MRSLLSFSLAVAMWSHSIMAIQNLRVSNAFKNAAIYPDIVPEPPEDILEVYYATSKVCLGNDIPHTHTVLRPTVEYDADHSVNYTLIMIDPDLPAAATPAYRSTLQWLVVNIPGEKLQPKHKTVNVPGENKLGGRSVAAYLPLSFYPGSGYRRYVFLLYAQTKMIDESDRNLQKLGIFRIRFSVQDFVKDYELGKLVAGNYFVSSLYTNERFCKH